MTTNATQLLKLLGSGIQPAASCDQRRGERGSGAFADLLKQAQSGGLASSLPVTIGSDAQAAGVNLNADQLARLSIAADQLETAGVRNALVTIDGQKLLLDVQAREIRGQAPNASGVVDGIDGVMDFGDARSTSGGAGLAPNGTVGAQSAAAFLRQIGPPAATLAGSASAMKLLASISRQQPGTLGA